MKFQVRNSPSFPRSLVPMKSGASAGFTVLGLGTNAYHARDGPSDHTRHNIRAREVRRALLRGRESLPRRRNTLASSWWRPLSQNTRYMSAPTPIAVSSGIPKVVRALKFRRFSSWILIIPFPCQSLGAKSFCKSLIPCPSIIHRSSLLGSSFSVQLVGGLFCQSSQT